MKLTSLPDYPALKKLACSLWQQDNTYHGAAVMVGAGFSRSAALTGDVRKKLPLWNDFSKILSEELKSKSSSPLRLAEEYSAFFGKQGLHDLIRKAINNAAWNPSELHYKLLKLPWSEVLTTNWDTLLERASFDVHNQVYCVVNKQEDLSSARSPRIVKLHGTIDVTNELIFTQEDYRKYPQHYAAFVNFARQVFIENELCLLGFSGEDPNFVEWAGWVRDNLTAHSRRIYLVGALNLNGPDRKYLESINIAPIDLSELVSDFDDHEIKHYEATKIFLQFLADSKPVPAWEWEPSQLTQSYFNEGDDLKTLRDPAFGAKILESQLPSLASDRDSYPGWLVCPQQVEWLLKTQISSPWPRLQHMPLMSPGTRERLLYELVWRYEKTFEALPSWLIEELLTVCDPSKPCEISKRQQLEVANLLMKNTRWMAPTESNRVYQVTSKVLEEGIKLWPESRNEFVYHQALVARDNFDYPALEKYLEQIEDLNAVWMLRKAALLAELGRFDQGEKYIAESHRDLLAQYRNNRKSIYIQSRLAWAQWLLQGVEVWSSKNDVETITADYQISKCNPWDHIEQMHKQINNALEEQQKQKAIEPSFEPGIYKDNANRKTFNNGTHPLLLLEGLTSTVGIPLSWKFTGFLADKAARLAEIEDIGNSHRFSLAIRAANSDSCDVLNTVFSRIKIACLPQDDVDLLLNICIIAIEFWSEKLVRDSDSAIDYIISRLRVFIEVLARTSIRATPEQAIRYFRLATDLCNKKDLQHIWLWDSLRHLTEFSLTSIPQNQHCDILLDALSVPLGSELDSNIKRGWVNPVINSPGVRQPNTLLDRRIDIIIDHIVPNSSQSAAPLLRMLPLIANGFLNQDEINKIKNNIWGAQDDVNALAETGLLQFSLLCLPSPNPDKVKSLVREYIFDTKDNDEINQTQLVNIINVARNEDTKEFPEPEQAIMLFTKLLKWRRQNNEQDTLGILEQKDQTRAQLIGKALSYSIVPSLSSAELNEQNFQKLYDFYQTSGIGNVLLSLPRFVYEGTISTEHLENILKRSLQSKDSNTVAHASFAILDWRKQTHSANVQKLVDRLIVVIESGRMPGLQALLQTANNMFLLGFLTTENILSLIECLPEIFDNTTYINVIPSSREAVSVSFVRAECVRLAKNIMNDISHQNDELNRILEESKLDALPEVRFAYTTVK
ncbi:SIR2 family NAD-dependent protein deacylase [Leclercia adecarboxylata]|uniref:SIR2 family NAD-dependent protein deacylase n=1 Tax=Leclercia adecarboxylata TaxID=83655 RepID=UPI00384C6619